jgi:hypothetical protein
LLLFGNQQCQHPFANQLWFLQLLALELLRYCGFKPSYSAEEKIVFVLGAEIVNSWQANWVVLENPDIKANDWDSIEAAAQSDAVVEFSLALYIIPHFPAS